MTTPNRLRLSDFVAPLLLSLGVFLLFLKGPGLGDDFSYWRIGWSIHEQGFAGWDANSFHNLRWPIWGGCWLLQGVLGPGSLSFYGVPLFYLLLASCIVYLLAFQCLRNKVVAVGAVLLFLFHPLLNTVLYRPMPDLPEGTFIGLAVLLWIALVESQTRWARALWALAIGVTAAVLFSNRITGIFVFGVLPPVAAVMAWKNERFSWKEALVWLGIVGAFFLCFVSIEGLIYKRLTGDFFHAIHTNLGARGRKGTESIALYKFPFRFLGVLWKSGRLSPFFFIATVIGSGVLWVRGGRSGRVIVAWSLSLYLAYSCSLQSLFPPRPLLRDADRFLCSLALPFSIMAAAGGLFVLEQLRRIQKLTLLLRKPLFQGVMGLILLAASLFILSVKQGRRTLFNRGFIPDLAHYLDQLPPGTSIFTHSAMRSAAFLANGKKAGQMEWYAPKSIFHHKVEHEQAAAKAQEFWYCRKISWLRTRQLIERGTEVEEQQLLGSYFIEPDAEWTLQRAIPVGQVPEFILYSRQSAEAARSVAVPLQQLVPSAPSLPLEWGRPEDEKKGKKTLRKSYNIAVPESIRGKALSVRLRAKANFVQAVRLAMIFNNGEGRVERLEFRPYFHPDYSIDFHTFEVPSEATSCRVELFFPPKSKELSISDISILVSPLKWD